MSPETEAQISNVRKFGRIAKSLCALAAVVLVLFLLVSWWSILCAPRVGGFEIGLGAYTVQGAQLATFGIKIWAFVVVTVVFAILLALTLRLRGLFTELAAGAIYTRENVRHIRNIGLLAMAMAVLQIVLPMISVLLVEIGFVDRGLVTFQGAGQGGALLFGPSSLSAFAMPALVLLASWIMDVGRQTKDEAEALRRDADLVI
jgi:Protein of unknown function (DUF2975)